MFNIRKHTFPLLALLVLVLLSSCGTSRNSKSSASADTRYRRQPIKETTDERLAMESALVDAKMKEEVGKTDEALARYRKILGSYPDNATAHYEMSRIYAVNGNIDSALSHAASAVQLGPDNVWFKLHLAALYRYTNQNHLCSQTWESIVRQNPDVLEYYYELSNSYLAENDIKNAISALDRVERKVGVTEEVSLQKVRLWNAVGRDDKAMGELEKLAMSMPSDGKYNSMIAESYMKSGKYDKAKLYYDRALAANPDDVYAHISLAEYYKAKKQPCKAYEELHRGFELPGLSANNKLQILTNFYTSEEFYGSQSQYSFDLLSLIMQQCDDSTAYAAFYGDVLMRQGKYTEASRQFALALSADSSKYEVWEALLVSELQGLEDTVRLASDARRASSLFPMHPLPYYIQAVIAHDNKDYRQAITLLGRCEKMGFDRNYLEAETYILMAECLNRIDDPASYSYYEKYLKFHPDDLSAVNSYAYRLALDGKDLDRALKMSKRTIDAEPDNGYYLDTYAWILHRLGRDKEALPYMERAVKRSDLSDEVRQHYEIILKAAK